ncbi:hypothetical protein OG481_17040 [Streptomyces longwoodensis]|uniref:hypothetical protein n=1 Tax=Streptomyces longwoodensis TaxID=68231 RepID=UPI00225910B3|nr:hypothetical protein [Streptomyces longwoodensis]MCX4995333.1 hypothetical protein [Streptomyces longwoodensis]WRY90103.1 hypothetical protein OG481_17040 [Streptomyces longwoodensis]WUC71882.1 hypothetical protein OG416_14245 [Streptomyces longwoodensis]
MKRTLYGSAGAVLLLTGAVACQDGGSDGQGAQRSAAQVLTAAFEKTTEAKSARVTMTMSAPDTMKDGGDMTASGVLGWDPAVMDLTVEGSALAAEPDAPKKVRMIWRDNVMYMDMGETAAREADLGGKRWMKMDLGALAEESGGDALGRKMSGGLADMNQDPAQQLALLLDSPNLKHLGSEKIDGQRAEHYKGTLTVEEMMDSNDSLDLLGPAERKQLLGSIRKSGIKGYDTEVWVDQDDLPVRMDVAMDTPEGTVEMSMTYADYGAKAQVTPPPAAQTFDFLEMFRDLGEAGRT